MYSKSSVYNIYFLSSLVVTHLRCETHADISRNELVLLRLTGAMEKGEVDARGGMVAGSVFVHDVQTQGKTRVCSVSEKIAYSLFCVQLHFKSSALEMYLHCF